MNNSLFTIHRKIYRALSPELALEYIQQQIANEYPEIKYPNRLPQDVYEIINNNEIFHETYGIVQPNGLKQVKDESIMAPAYSYVSGYRQCANFIICPFDWSWETNGDFDYTFFLAKTISSDKDME